MTGLKQRIQAETACTGWNSVYRLRTGSIRLIPSKCNRLAYSKNVQTGPVSPHPRPLISYTVSGM